MSNIFQKTFLIVWRIFIWSFFLFGSLFLVILFINVSGVNVNNRASFSMMLAGEAYKPYVTRVLVPALINGIFFLTPTIFKNYIDQFISNSDFTFSLLRKFIIPKELYVQGVICIFIMWISLMGFIVNFKLLAQFFLKDKNQSLLLTFIACVCLPIFFEYGYIYDFTVLCLFCLSFRLLVNEKYLNYYLLFPFLVLLKETSIILPGVFFLFNHNKVKTAKLHLLINVILQFFIFFLIRIAILYSYRANLGGLVESYLHIHYVAFFYNFNITILILLITSFILGMIVKRRKIIPYQLKSTAIVFLPIFFSLYILFGYPVEIRVFYELYPVILLIIFICITKNSFQSNTRE